jgi:cytochrome c553
MKTWKMTLTAAAAAAMLMTGCGDKKSESNDHGAAAAKPQTHSTETKPAAKPVETQKPAKTEATSAAHAVQSVSSVASSTAAVPPLPGTTPNAAEAKVAQVSASVDTAITKAKEAVSHAVKEQPKIDTSMLYAKCAGCHGFKGEKHALGQSNIIAGQSADELVKKIEGYQNGTYGGAMKGLMAGQVKNLKPEEIKALADYISKF